MILRWEDAASRYRISLFQWFKSYRIAWASVERPEMRPSCCINLVRNQRPAVHLTHGSAVVDMLGTDGGLDLI
jgi:hypothetical protein